MLHGEVRNRKAIAFDYNYWVGRVNHGKHHHVSAAIIACEAPFPEIVIRPEKALDKLVGAVGFEDIDFESHEFSKKFLE